MSSSTYAQLVIVAAIAAAPTGEVLGQVFNELGLLMAVMGMAGGMARGLILGLKARETIRGAVIGALFAFGVGSQSPHFLSWLLGIELDDATQGGLVPVLSTGAFLIGAGQDWLLSKVIRPKQQEEGADG